MTIRRIISMDGGPAAGSWVRCLRDIAKAHPTLLTEADVFAGTSAGAFAAAWLARHLPVGATVKQVAKATEALVSASNELLTLLSPDEGGYMRLLTGSGAMVEGDHLVAFLQREEVLGKATTLGDLKHHLIIVASRTNAPWAPHIHANFGADAEPDTLLVDAVMRSTAFPLLLPGWQDHADGAMFVNNPAAVALGWAHDALGTSPETMLISFGGDDGSSALSNLTTPHDTDDKSDDKSDHKGEEPGLVERLLEGAAKADPTGVVAKVEAAAERVLDGVEAGVHALEARASDLVADALGHATQPTGPYGAVIAGLSKLDGVDQAAHDAGMREIQRAAEAGHAMEEQLRERLKDALREAGFNPRRRAADDDGDDVDADELDDWGWQAWLAYLFNPLYAMQIFLNSQGRGTHDVVRRLMGPGRALRVAPVALMPTNAILLAMVLSQPELAKEAGVRTAELWSNPVTNALLQFETPLAAVEAFMADWAA